MYLSIDVGTSAAKMSVVDDDVRELVTARAGYPFIMGPGSRVEMDPDDVIGALQSAATQFDPGLLGRVDRLVYDTFSPSLTLIRGDGALAYPRIVTHLDRRSSDQSAWIVDNIGVERFLAITGMQPFAGGSGAVTLRWFVDHEPGLLKGVARVNNLAGYLHELFTGEVLTDRVNASMLGAYCTTTAEEWSTELISALGFEPSWFAPVRNPGEEAGRLTPAMAKLLGIRSGIPVTVGTNDMAAAQVGAGNTEAGQIMNTAGSSDMISILTDVPQVDHSYYLRNAALPNTWQIYATTAGGFALEWFHAQFARELVADDFFGVFLDRVVDGLLESSTGKQAPVAFEPFLTGDRQSLTPKTATWRGLTLASTREQMLGALLDGMVSVLGETIALAGNTTRLDRVIKVSGGLATSTLLRLKRARWPAFELRSVDNCSILGNVKLAQLHDR